MKREIPRIILDGNLFDLDFQGKQFIQTTYPENRISFDHLQLKGDYFLLHYNTQQKLALTGEIKGDKPNQHTLIQIHQAVLTEPAHALDRKGFCKMHNQQSYQRGLNVLLIEESIHNRMNGKLPEIEIAGERYYVDLRMRALRPHDDFINRLEFKNMQLTTSDQYHFLYSPNDHQILSWDPQLKEYTKGMVKVTIPTEKHLDPISCARLSGLEDTALLPAYPQKSKQRAQVSSLENIRQGLDAAAGKNSQRKHNAPDKPQLIKRRKGKKL